MGYNTTFQLSAKPLPTPDPAESIAALVRSNSEADYCLTDEGDPNESGKWYQHESDLIEHSRHYPALVFTLRGEGEEQGDLWEKDFCNGMMVERKATIAIPAQDLSAFIHHPADSGETPCPR